MSAFAWIGTAIAVINLAMYAAGFVGAHNAARRERGEP